MASFQWVIGATSTSAVDRYACGEIIGYPACVNETYGCMSADCLIRAYRDFGLNAHQKWVTFDEAYAIARETTGQLNGVGWYHYVAIRGVHGPDIWIANSAEGYRGIYSTLSRSQFNSLGPFQVVYLDPRQ